MRARDQTLLHYPVETFNKIVTSGQFQRLKPSGVAGPPILCATHRRHVLEMSVLGYAVCAAVITACEDDPSPKLLQLTDLTDLAQHAVCNKIGNMKTKPVIDWAMHQPRSLEDPAGEDCASPPIERGPIVGNGYTRSIQPPLVPVYTAPEHSSALEVVVHYAWRPGPDPQKPRVRPSCSPSSRTEPCRRVPFSVGFSLPPCGVCLLCGCRWFIL